MDIEELIEDAIMDGGSDTSLRPEDYPLDADQATKWLAELNMVRRKRAEVNAAVKAAVERINKAVADRITQLNSDEAFLEECLEVYHKVRLAEDPEGAKTLTYPTGTLKARKQPDSWEHDDKTFEKWAVVNMPGVVSYVPKVAWGEAKKSFAKSRISDGKVCLTDGTVVPGVTVRPGAKKFTAETEYE